VIFYDDDVGNIPAELSRLSSLKVLYLQNNELEGSVPSEFSHLSKLEVLDLHHNRLSGIIPAELSELGRMQHLRLSNNHFTGIKIRQNNAVSFIRTEGTFRLSLVS